MAAIIWHNSHMNVNQISAYLAITLLVALGVAIFRASAVKLKFVDMPNERSMHSIPTPRGAGAVFVSIWSIAIIINSVNDFAVVPLFALAASVVVAVIGAYDDCRSLNVSLRLCSHISAAVFVLFLLRGLSIVEFSVIGNLENPFILNVIGLVSLVWMVNLFNFMDGTDGLAASEGLFVSLVGALVLFFSGDVETATWLFYLAAGLAGFLVWNFPPAKVFMGDSGSSFLGFFFGTVALISHNSGSTTIWFWLILMGCFTVDATVTIVTRFLNKEKVTQAHRTHVFQRIAGKYESHALVVFGYSFINICWLLPLALLSHLHRDWAFIWFVVAYVPLMIMAFWLGAGRVLCVGKLTREIK